MVLLASSGKNKLSKVKEIKQIWTGPKKFDSCFSIIFGCYDQNFICGIDTGYLAVSPPNLDIFLIFHSFLIC